MCTKPISKVPTLRYIVTKDPRIFSDTTPREIILYSINCPEKNLSSCIVKIMFYFHLRILDTISIIEVK